MKNEAVKMISIPAFLIGLAAGYLLGVILDAVVLIAKRGKRDRRG